MAKDTGYSSNPVREDIPESEAEPLAQKRKGHPDAGDSGVVPTAPSPKRVAPGPSSNVPPSTLKDWISSIRLPMWRREMFEN